jgi:hypothetical protein
MKKMTLTMIMMILVLLLIGCGAHQITSSPPGAAIYTYQASGMIPVVYTKWHRPGKPTPEQMNMATKSSRPIVTPHTFKGGPFDHWYQVRKEGYYDSDIVFLKESEGTLSHHFTLKKRPDSSTSDK